jgi:hypothetical protein
MSYEMRRSSQNEPHPSAWRLALAFVIAPLCGAVTLTVFQLGPSIPLSRLISSVKLLSIGGFSATILFGLPLYFLLRIFVSPSLIKCALTGSLVAVAPGLLLNLLPMSEHFQFGVGDRATVVDGYRTAYGWELWRTSLAKTAAAGFAAGAVFWIVSLYRFTSRKSG